jgi:hypothetical protein
MASNFRDFNGDPGDHLHGKTTITINLWFLYYLLNKILIVLIVALVL